MSVVELDHVTKHFRTRQHLQGGLKSFLVNPGGVFRWRATRPFVALEDICLSVNRGEFFGVLGRNGAGKSTLLELIGGILQPSSGTVTTRGRICQLMELGVGLEPLFTGRENVLLNGILLGLRRRAVEARMDEIIEFSGLRDFIDEPLLTYSAGMQMRLGFSVAIHSDPEILLVDEVLAVGDESFQQRCLVRIEELQERGVTVVLVSHDLEMLTNRCDRVAWLESGRLVCTGAPHAIVKEYRYRARDAGDPRALAEIRWRGPEESAEPPGSGSEKP